MSVTVKPRSLNVDCLLRESLRIDNLNEKDILESIVKKCDMDALITILLKAHPY